MPLGYSNISQVNMTTLTNFTDPAGFIININWEIYLGWFAFIMLIITWYGLFMLLQQREDQPMPNLVMTGGVITVISLLLRFVFVIVDGGFKGMLTAGQMWIFPVLTIIFTIIAVMMKE